MRQIQVFVIQALVASLSAVLLCSCMHMGMMGTGEDRKAGSTLDMSAESVLEKEVVAGDIKAIAMFPPLQLDNDVIVSLRLVDAKTSQPITGAKVYFHSQHARPPGKNGVHDHSGARPDGRQESEYDINIEQKVKETLEAGVYSTPYGSNEQGAHTLMFHIVAVGDRKLDPEITIEAKRILMQRSHEHSGGMMGMGSTTTYVIIGAAVMGVMVAAMLLVQGSMF